MLLSERDKILWLVKDSPVDIGSAGSIRIYRLLKYLVSTGKYDITCLSSSANYGTKPLEALGIKTATKQDMTSIIKEAMNKDKFQACIISWWYVANAYTKIIKEIDPNINIIIDTVDIEWIRNRRAIGFKKVEPSYAKEREIQEKSIYKSNKYFLFVTDEDRNIFNEEMNQKIDSEIVSIPYYEKTSIPYKNKEELYFIGNYGHAPNIHAAVKACEVFQEVLKHMPNLKLRVIGKYPSTEIKKFHNDKNIFVVGVDYKLEESLKSLSVALLPIFYGGGINGKILEAMSHGIPVVTDEFGARCIPEAKNAENIMIAKNEKEMCGYVIKLLTDDKLYGRVSHASQGLINKYFKYETIGQKLDSFLFKICNPLI